MKNKTSQKIITASELGTYVYCARAWWYRNQNAPNENLPAMNEGTRFHRKMGRRLSAMRIARIILILMLFSALGLISWWIVANVGAK